ncbi:MAG: sigma-70 family RNA polymerase sigma factor [Burkholderiales bacterium]|nr:sigma-70 family RNA polymerase sigma factor [Burkholderiales bacterium]
MGQVTTLLSAIGQGRSEALGELYSLLYPELHRLAHSRVRRSGDLTLLDTTSLVHETFLRFEKSGAVSFGDRAQFMAYAAQVMRSVVVDVVRKRRSERAGGDSARVELDEEQHGAPDPRDSEILRVHESLEELAAIEPRLVRVVEMRYFAGMTEAEIAEVLGLGVRTVNRDWEKARLFLHASLR